ncbi:MAG TPA: T9SS type A sorting domain-containing protein [Bacteroidia bacterium]|nr:T9SS type A sorting domain-containing protein [Bacteroidia bacterium]
MKQFAFSLTFIFILAATLIPSYGQLASNSIILSGQMVDGEARAVIENVSGNYVITGLTIFGTDPGMYLVEMDPLGNILHSKTISSSSTIIPSCILQASGGYYIVAGYINDNSLDGDWFIAKLDSAFNNIWFKRMGTPANGDGITSCFEVSPDHFVFTGTIGLGGSTEPAVVMTDSSGSVIHEGYLTANQFSSGIHRGTYLGNGEIGFAGLDNAISIIDTSGNILKQGPFSVGDFTRDVVRDQNGGYAFYGGVGAINSGLTFGKVDSSLLTLQFAFKYTLSNYSLYPLKMLRNTFGKYVIVANTIGPIWTTPDPPIIIILNDDGTIYSSHRYVIGGSGSTINAISITSDGGYLIAGKTYGPGFIAKLDSTGGNCSAFNNNFSISPISSVNSVVHNPFVANITTLTSPLLNITMGTITSSVYCAAFTGIDSENMSKSSVKLFPSMFRDGFYISLNKPSLETYFVSLYDVTGRKVLEAESNIDGYVSIPGLASGTYIVRVLDHIGNSLFKGMAICIE